MSRKLFFEVARIFLMVAMPTVVLLAQEKTPAKGRGETPQAVVLKDKDPLPKSLKENPKDEKAKESPLAITPERIAEVERFVSHHHSELAELLKQLKETNERQYEKAVRELLTASQRLKQWQTNDPARYDLELKSWKLLSRIQLLSAKLTMFSQEEWKQELKQALVEHYELRHALLVLDREKLQERLGKAEKELAEHTARREAAINKQYDLLTSTHAAKKTEKRKDSESKPTTTLKP